MRREIAVAVALVCRGATAIAQSPTPPSTPPAPEWTASAEAGANAARGNSDFTALSAGFRLSHLDKRAFEFEGSGALTYSESNDKVIARRILGGLKGDWRPQATWSPFVFATEERDRIRRLDLLSNAGAGGKWTYYRNSAGAASMSAAAVHTYKAITDADLTAGSANEPRKSTLRLSLRPKLVQKYKSGVTIEQTTFWQPVMNEIGDYMIEAVSRVGFLVTKTHSVFVQHTYRFDSRPPTSVKREDQLLLAGLKVQF